MHDRRNLTAFMNPVVLLALVALVALSACASRSDDAAPRDPLPTASTVPPPNRGVVVGRHERVLVYMPQDGDTYASIAKRFLKDESLAWRIAEVNREAKPQPGTPLTVPLVDPNPLGVGAEGVQGVPILCYHRVGPGSSKMTISSARFEAQLDWLASNGYTVVTLDDVAAFMAGQAPLPDKAVAITFDDGYESVHRHAFPALRKRGMPATLFVYSDFIGAGEALGWKQMDEMLRTGLIEIQAHSKSHRNLAERLPAESEAAYRARIDHELRHPRATIEKALGASGARVRHFAYPYGDANEAVLDAMRRNGYELGLTVNPGVNPFYAAPMMLKRVMIYGDLELEEFKARLQGRRVLGRM